MNDSINITLTFEKAQKLNSHYTTIESKKELHRQLINIIDTENLTLYSNFSIHEIYNHLLIKYYPNETAVKSSFINNVLMNNKKNVAIFELPVINSRADLCRINGESTAYEIKTTLDNYNRLSSQINDYVKIFDKCFVICPHDKVSVIKNHITESIGIYSYKINRDGNYIYKISRKAKLVNDYDSFEQLSVLRKSELVKLVDKPDLTDKISCINYMLSKYSSKQINIMFKVTLKSRYQFKWEFLRTNYNKIMEIDYQWFFKNPIDPEIIYN